MSAVTTSTATVSAATVSTATVSAATVSAVTTSTATVSAATAMSTVLPDRPGPVWSAGATISRDCGPRDPAPLSPGQLVAFAQFLAREIRAGAHVVDFDPGRRWHRRLYRDGRVDVWLISWLPEQGTQLHDHGGSSGAFTVVEGQLSEAVLVRHGALTGSLRERRHRTGAVVGFDGRHVHDVRNLDAHPAVSVHAYSPPLTSMTFYDLEEGTLVPFAAIDTEDPETPTPGATRPSAARPPATRPIRVGRSPGAA